MVVAKEIDVEEIVSRARSLGPMIREMAVQTEALGKLHPDVVAALRQQGLFHAAAPRRFGGYGLEWDAVLEATVELGRYCGATSWCYTVWAIHTWWIGQMTLQAQEEFFATGPDTLASSSFGLGGGIERAVARRVDGGYRVTGRWKYSSGCDHAEWAMLGVLEASFGGEEPTIDANLPQLIADGTHLVLVPRADFEIIDDWDVSALRGTGSKSVVVRDAFVPEHRLTKLRLQPEENSIGWQLHQRLGYRLPLDGAWFTIFTSVFGMCQGVLDEFARDCSREGSLPLVQADYARATATVDSVLLLMRRDVREGLEKAARGEPVSQHDVLRVERDLQYGIQACLAAVGRVVEWSGAHTIQRTHPIQRLFRDAHAASKRARRGLQNYGEALLVPAVELAGAGR